MNYYSLTQWLLFFFLYCFIGWVWESCYVSTREKKWVNRGFLHGPFLPIYGAGAVTILISTINVRNNIFLVFLLGMLGATVLEYFTGALMEKIFGVRYWDYSNRFLNINGHICLIASLCWGFFSCIMVKIIHSPIEKMVLDIPDFITEIVAFVLVINMSVDFTNSFNEAMDLKAMLDKITSEHEHIRFVTQKLEIAYAFAEDEFRENKKKYNRKRRELAFIASRKKVHVKQYFEEKRNDLTDSVMAFKETKMAELSKIADRAKELLKDKLIDETVMKAIQETTAREQNKLNMIDNKQFNSLVKILRRNPTATSTKNREALEEIKHLMDK